MTNTRLLITFILGGIAIIAIAAVVVFVVIPAQQDAEATPTSNPIATFQSDATFPPSATFPSRRPTLPPIHTPTISPTPADTATARPTAADDSSLSTPSFMLPTPAVAPCLCDTNRYDCEYWENRLDMLACYTYCISAGSGDVHNLDGDADGIPCEGPR